MWRSKFSLLLFSAVLLFAQERDIILFQHQLHIDDLELSCAECHADVAKSDGIVWSVFPKMDQCLECHDGDTAEGACEYCHSNPENAQPFQNNWANSGLGFSHSKHMSEQQDCNQCHSYILEDDEIGSPKIWEKRQCFDCHKKLDQVPKSHDLSWQQFHGAEINASTETNCALCHTNNSCEECHQLQQFTPKTHPNDYILLHGFEAKAGVMECTTCHETVADCYSCHATNQIMPMNHNFHNWVTKSGGGLHEDFADGDAELCATCHLPSKDSSCLHCHNGNK